MRFLQIHLELEPVPGLPMVQSPLTPANDGERDTETGYREEEIGNRAEGLDVFTIPYPM